MSTRAARAIRGTVFAAIATVTAAVAHTLGGGEAPSPLFCAILFLLSVPAATALASPRPAPRRAALAVAVGQLLFHGAFAVTGDLGAHAPGSSAAAGHAHGAMTAWTMDAAASAGADMTLAHVIAALVVIALVCRGEDLLSRLAAWFVGRAAAATTVPGAPIPLRRVDAAPAGPRVRTILPPGLGRRGPPLLSRAPHAA